MCEECCDTKKRHHGIHRHGRHGHHRCCCCHGTWRRFTSREEKIEMVKKYREELKKELKAVDEKIEELS